MRILSVCFFLLFLVSCKEHKAYVSKNTNRGDAVITVQKEDDDMNNAIAKARNEYHSFIQIFKSADTSLSNFSVKMRFDYGHNNGEHMWLDQLHFRGEKLIGILDSDPVNIHSVRAGDSVVIDEDRVSDWIFVKNKRMVGGYTLKVLYDKMNEKERKELRDQLPFNIE